MIVYNHTLFLGSVLMLQSSWAGHDPCSPHRSWSPALLAGRCPAPALALPLPRDMPLVLHPQFVLLLMGAVRWSLPCPGIPCSSHSPQFQGSLPATHPVRFALFGGADINNNSLTAGVIYFKHFSTCCCSLRDYHAPDCSWQPGVYSVSTWHMCKVTLQGWWVHALALSSPWPCFMLRPHVWLEATF